MIEAFLLFQKVMTDTTINVKNTHNQSTQCSHRLSGPIHRSQNLKVKYYLLDTAHSQSIKYKNSISFLNRCMKRTFHSVSNKNQKHKKSKQILHIRVWTILHGYMV